MRSTLDTDFQEGVSDVNLLWGWHTSETGATTTLDSDFRKGVCRKNKGKSGDT